MKRKVYNIILNSVFLVIFNLTFFLLKGSDVPISVWISYGFIHAAYLILITVHFLTPQSTFHAVLNFSTVLLSIIYFYIELAIGVLFIILKLSDFKISLIVQSIIFAVFLIILLLTLIKNEDTAKSISKHEEAVYFIKESSSRIKRLIGLTNSNVLDNRLSKIFDVLHNSPAKSVAEAKRFELEIFEKIAKLTENVMTGDIEQSLKILNIINILLSDRNNIVNR